MSRERAARAHSVTDMRALARRVLPRAIFDLADGGAEDEQTLSWNESAFSRLALRPRPLNGVPSRDLGVSLFGHDLSMPVMIGPTGLAGLFWPDGERAAARAAHTAGTAYCLSHASVCTLETLAETGISPRWMQVFIYRDRGFTRELADRAAAAGYDALVLTTDNQILGNRERDIHNGFTIPPRLGAAEIFGMAVKPGWLWRMRRDIRRITFGNYVRKDQPEDVKALAGRMASLLDPAMDWRDVDELRKQWKGPLLLKGVLHPDEARQACEHGIDGLIVSNHGGRQLDGAPAAIDALPDVVDAVAGRMPVLVDGGLRRGADVVKALCLGATATLIGRPQLWGLTVGGEAGVARILETFRHEIDRVMALCGASDIADLTSDLLFRPATEGAGAHAAGSASVEMQDD